MAESSYTERLTPLDVVMPSTYVRVLFVFEQPSSTSSAIQSLQPSLDRLAKQIPWLSGRVFPGAASQDKAASPEIRWDVNDSPRIVDKGTIATSYEQARSHGMPSEDFPAEVWPVSSIIDEATSAKGAPVFATSAFRFADQGVGLCVCLHHNVVDATGFAEILRLWIENMMDETFSFSNAAQSRNERLSEALSVDRQEVSSVSIEDLLVRHPEFSKSPPALPASFPSCTSKIFPISAHWIDTLRELMLPYTSKRPSTNTVLCALIWTAITRIRMGHNPSLTDNVSRLGMAVNGRQRISQTFSPPDSPFFGNAVTYSLSEMSAEVLAASDRTPVRALAEICDRIAQSQSSDVINSRHIAEVSSLVDRVGHKSLFVGWDLFGSRDLSITNWADFDLYGMNFGNVLGSPAFVRLPYMEADGVGIILPRRRSGAQEVLEVMVMLRRDHMKSLEQDQMWQTLGSRRGNDE